MYVIVVGGGKVGYYLARTLLEENHEVLLVEKEPAKVERLKAELGEVVLGGDGAEMSTMVRAGASRADVVAAVTGHDEDNLVICQMAKWRFNVPRVLARINNPRNREIFHLLNIDAVVNSTEIILHLLEQQMPTPYVIPLAPLRRGDIEIVEADVVEDSPVAGQMIGQVSLPEDTLIIAVIRPDQVIIPKPDTVLTPGDTVLAICKSDREAELRGLFAAALPI